MVSPPEHRPTSPRIHARCRRGLGHESKYRGNIPREERRVHPDVDVVRYPRLRRAERSVPPRGDGQRRSGGAAAGGGCPRSCETGGGLWWRSRRNRSAREGFWRWARPEGGALAPPAPPFRALRRRRMAEAATGLPATLLPHRRMTDATGPMDDRRSSHEALSHPPPGRALKPTDLSLRSSAEPRCDLGPSAAVKHASLSGGASRHRVWHGPIDGNDRTGWATGDRRSFATAIGFVFQDHSLRAMRGARDVLGRVRAPPVKPDPPPPRARAATQVGIEDRSSHRQPSCRAVKATAAIARALIRNPPLLAESRRQPRSGAADTVAGLLSSCMRPATRSRVVTHTRSWLQFPVGTRYGVSLVKRDAGQ